MEEGVELIVTGEGVEHVHGVKKVVEEEHFCLEEVVVLGHHGHYVEEEGVELDHRRDDHHVHVLEGVGLCFACLLLTVDWLPLSLHASLQSHK